MQLGFLDWTVILATQKEKFEYLCHFSVANPKTDFIVGIKSREVLLTICY